jgi:uracil permease
MLVFGLGGATFTWGKFELSGLGLAAIIGILLNLILNFKSIFRGGGVP